MKAQNVIGLCGVDTRALTRAIRENGVMNGIITDSKTLTPAQQALLDSYGNAVSFIDFDTLAPIEAWLKKG